MKHEVVKDVLNQVALIDEPRYDWSATFLGPKHPEHRGITKLDFAMRDLRRKTRFSLDFDPDLSCAGSMNPEIRQVDMNPLPNFDTVERYYGTLFHEHAHVTMVLDDRCDLQRYRYEPGARAKEEMVAELTSVVVRIQLGWEIDPRHFHYIAAYLERARECCDDKSIRDHVVDRSIFATETLEGFINA